MTFADYLTLLRLLIVPFFLYTFLIGEFQTAFILFIIAGTTDLIDGTIARLMKQSTDFGALLDPIADKALMISTASCLLLEHVIPVWFFLLVVSRDVSILGGLAYLRIKKITFDLKPVLASKLGTLSNIVLVIFAFVWFLYPHATFFKISLRFWFDLFLYVSTTLVLISGLQYVAAGLKILRGLPRPPASQ
ncbi:MAG: CDP-alcohol phosphatidyltransferase family protein [Deltaproteobacteria bacterium]|nr:CDP-alcohol phosphatidyltransferase family protein [Deltaproteobacteria bacterium]